MRAIRQSVLLAAAVCLVGCGTSDDAERSGAAVADDVIDVADAAGDSSVPFVPPQPQFGPLADLDQGVNVVDVPQRLFIVVASDDVVGFDRKDPNNGCVLFEIDEQQRIDNGIADPAVVFFDQCHGHAYDVHGEPVLCPGTRSLRRVDFDVIDGVVTRVGMTIDPAEAPPLRGEDCPDFGQH